MMEPNLNTMSLTAVGVRTQAGLFFQRNNTIGGVTGQTFCDGVRCCGQNVGRIEILTPPGPEPATATMTETATTNGGAGTIQPGDKKCYQYWYRDPGGNPCGSNFNLSNAVSVIWLWSVRALFAWKSSSSTSGAHARRAVPS